MKSLCTVLTALTGTVVSAVWLAGSVAQSHEDEKKSERTTARQYLDQALRTADEVKDPGQKAGILVAIAKGQAAAGDPSAARKSLLRAFKLGNALPGDKVNDFFHVRHFLVEIAAAQAEVGDLDGALKTLAAFRKPKNIDQEDEGVQRLVDSEIASARVGVGCALARTGKYKEAAETVRSIDEDEKLRNMKWPVLVEIVAAQAKAGEWKRARETARTIEPEDQQITALLAIARRQAKAGLAEEAKARIAEAFKVVPGESGDDSAQYQRIKGLQAIALAQADIGDLKSALATAETIPVLELFFNVRVPPYKKITLAMLRARAGDFKGAMDAHRDADILRLIARTKAEGKDIKGALATVAEIQHSFVKALAYVDIAQVQVRAGNPVAAATLFEKAREAHQDANLWRALASAMAETGQEQTAQGWIAKLESPHLKAWALVGMAEGLAHSNIREDWRTDSEGRITWRDLVPGATYRINNREFTVKSGETLDLGDLK